LNEAWKRFLLDATVERIHHHLGDFIATELTYGGAIQTTTIATMVQGDTKSSVQAELAANYREVFSSASASISSGGSSSYKTSKHTFQTKIGTFGGKSSIWARLSKDNFDAVQQEWAESINDKNQFEVEFKLVPIWTLLDHDDMDRAKAHELERHILQKWKSSSDQIPQYASEKPAGPKCAPRVCYNGGKWDPRACACKCRGNAKHGWTGPYCRKTYGSCQPGAGSWNPDASDQCPVANKCASWTDSHTCKPTDVCCATKFGTTCCPFGSSCQCQFNGWSCSCKAK